MIISHIVAASKNNIIGTDNTLPWDLPEDMKFFKEKTKGHSIIMGRKTYESIGRPLPHRLNIIITRQEDYQVGGAHVVSTIDAAITLCKEHRAEYGEEAFIIGGGEIYKQSLPLTDVIYLTRIHQDFQGHTSYPALNPTEFEETDRQDRTEPIPFSFLVYKRK